MRLIVYLTICVQEIDTALTQTTPARLTPVDSQLRVQTNSLILACKARKGVVLKGDRGGENKERNGIMLETETEKMVNEIAN